jgi:2-polyprenyl-3-methyl-5-hydroxy-6-metoxy-1,4-benzoquinol methylase
LGLQGGQAEVVGTVEGPLGVHTSYGWEMDPKRLGFTAARYKFVGKMLEGKKSVLEVGCGDAFFSRVVRQHMATDGFLQVVDINRGYIGSAKKNNPKDGRWRVYPGDWDILNGPLAPATRFEAVYCLDVFEHIAEEDLLLGNLSRCAPVCLVGAPSLESQAWASEISKLEHVNCKTKEGLREAMKRHFSQVFMFGMNDEVLHTGHMPAYLFALGVNASTT